MLGDISKAEHIYIAVGYTDMRKQMMVFQLSFNKISSLILFLILMLV